MKSGRQSGVPGRRNRQGMIVVGIGEVDPALAQPFQPAFQMGSETLEIVVAELVDDDQDNQPRAVDGDLRRRWWRLAATKRGQGHGHEGRKTEGLGLHAENITSSRNAEQHFLR